MNIQFMQDNSWVHTAAVIMTAIKEKGLLIIKN